MEVYPVKFEAYDCDMGVFQVEQFDEGAATVKISSVVNVALWDEISVKIRECLVAMKLEGEQQKGEM